MRAIRRAGAAAVAAVLCSGFIGGGASANTDQPETYAGNALGRALNIQALGIQATLGSSAASIDSGLNAVGQAAGVVGLPLVGANVEEAKAVGDGASDVNAEVCATPQLVSEATAALPIVQLDAACSLALAEVVDAKPRALGTGTVSRIDVNANTVLEVPIATLAPVVQQLLNQETLQGALELINNTVGTDLAVDDTVETVLGALGGVRTLEVRLGKSVSESVTTDTAVVSTATSEAGTIALLPGAIIDASGNAKPLAEIIIGSAKASMAIDRSTGTPIPGEAVADAAIVTIRLNTPTTDAVAGELQKITGIDVTEIVIAPDLNVLPALGPLAAPCTDGSGEYCLLEGTPLETRIATANARIDEANGVASADAVKVHALRNIGEVVPQLQGGLLLELSHVEAGAKQSPAVVTPPSVVEIPRELPRTGGTPLVAVAGGSALLLAVASRRVLVRAR